MESLKRDIATQIEWVRQGRQSAAQALLAIERLIGCDHEYVTLDAVLGRGRHEDESGVDLRFPTR